MFGYITVNRPELKVKDLELYRSYYCGLCAELYRRHGRFGQILLSYDCTFLLLLLSGLYEPKVRERFTRCLLHPGFQHHEKVDRFTLYAADMNLMLGYLKARDDWNDEGKKSACLLSAVLWRDYNRTRKNYPRQDQALRKSLKALRLEEKRGLSRESGAMSQVEISERIDRTAGCTGRFFAELCVPYEDQWAADLRGVGFYLGKFVYLIDAYDDLEQDRKLGAFNVLRELQEADPENFDGAVRAILLDTAACCCRYFERLPILRDVDLLRNVLYSGIWVRFYEIQKGTERQKKTADCPVSFAHL